MHRSSSQSASLPFLLSIATMGSLIIASAASTASVARVASSFARQKATAWSFLPSSKIVTTAPHYRIERIARTQCGRNRFGSTISFGARRGLSLGARPSSIGSYFGTSFGSTFGSKSHLVMWGEDNISNIPNAPRIPSNPSESFSTDSRQRRPGRRGGIGGREVNDNNSNNNNSTDVSSDRDSWYEDDGFYTADYDYHNYGDYEYGGGRKGNRGRGGGGGRRDSGGRSRGRGNRFDRGGDRDWGMDYGESRGRGGRRARGGGRGDWFDRFDSRSGGGRFDRNDRYDRNERGGRGGRGDRFDRGGRGGRGDRNFRDESPTSDKSAIKTNLKLIESSGYQHLYGIAPVLNALKAGVRDFTNPEDKREEEDERLKEFQKRLAYVDGLEGVDGVDGVVDEEEDGLDQFDSPKATAKEIKPEAKLAPCLFLQETTSTSSSSQSNRGNRNNRSNRDNAKQKAIHELLTLAQDHPSNLPVVQVDKGVLNTLCGNRPHQGVVLRCGGLDFCGVRNLPPPPAVMDSNELEEGDESVGGGSSPFPEPKLWLALDEVVDPQNLGALIRSAYFLGGGPGFLPTEDDFDDFDDDFDNFDDDDSHNSNNSNSSHNRHNSHRRRTPPKSGGIGILVTAKNSSPLTPTVSAASAGALEFMTIYSTGNLPKLLNGAREDGWRVLGAAAEVPGYVGYVGNSKSGSSGRNGNSGNSDGRSGGSGGGTQESVEEDNEWDWDAEEDSESDGQNQQPSQQALQQPYAPQQPHAPQQEEQEEQEEQEGQQAVQRILDLHEVPTDQPTILVLGSEGRGLRTLVARSCTDFVRIPGGLNAMSGGSLSTSSSSLEAESGEDGEESSQAGVDSLNVSVTGGILLWHFLSNQCPAT